MTSIRPANMYLIPTQKMQVMLIQQDVRGIVTNYDNILDFNFVDIDKNSYIWVGNEDKNWNVYKHVDHILLKKLKRAKQNLKYIQTQMLILCPKGQIIGMHSVYDVY